ncbi:MAG: M20/M25/M40 family metallo-hydrolase [Acutalibacteraceae bacterium]
MDIRALAEKYEGYIIEQRRWFHAHPELSWEEFGTTDHIQEELEKMGLEVHRFEGRPGCTAMIYGGKAVPGAKTVALRADIDALPVEETTKMLFASENPGATHACGHDNHMAMLLGAAKILCEVKDELEGNAKAAVPGGRGDLLRCGVLCAAGCAGRRGCHLWTAYLGWPGSALSECTAGRAHGKLR